MAENPKDSFSSALTLFGSIYQDMNPADLPEGLSPDNQDMYFLPGSVGTRPALNKLLNAPYANTPTVMSIAEFHIDGGDFFMTTLDSLGILRWNGVLGGGATEAILPASQFKAESAFDKQFLAVFNAAAGAAFSSDPFVGADPPRWYDGNAFNNVYRVTSDAPALGNFALADLNPTVAITSINTNVGITIVAAPNGAAELGLVATIQTTAPHGFKVGDFVSVTGVAVGGYNNVVGQPWQITAVPSPTSFSFIAGAAGLGTSGNGAANPLITTVLTTTPHGLNVGDPVVISGSVQPNYNNLPPNGITPPSWIVTSIPNASAFTFIGVSNPGLDNSGAITMKVGGKVVAGPRNAVVIFDIQGGLTAPSVPIQFTSAGARQIQATNVPLGPPGTKRRIIAFTQAFGSSYFYITPALVPGIAGLPTVLSVGTIIPDNVTTTITMDFSDVGLASGTQIDAPGNNLFNQIVLGPCLGTISYQGREFWWGEINNIKNLINSGFEGGPVAAGTPPGWVNTNTTGGTVNTDIGLPLTTGESLAMNSAGGARDCLISQPAYQDYYGGPIFQPNTTYIFRVATQRSAGVVVGNLIAELFSPGSGSIANASIPVNPITTGGGYGWSVAIFNVATPAVIPADTIIRIYLQNVTNLTTVHIDELEFIPQSQPVLNNQLRASYFGNPFGYDSITGVVGLTTKDSLTAAFRQRDYLYLLTTRGRWVTQNNGSTEPNGWTISEQEQDCGCFSPCAVDVTEGVAFWSGRHGRRVFVGGAQSKLVSLELQTTWGNINYAAQLSAWVAVDPIERLVHFGVPIGPVAGTPTADLTLSYRAVDAVYNVPDPIRQSFRGNMIALELSRKSTIWNVKLNCGAMITRPLPSGDGNAPFFVVGGGNGLAPGAGAGFGNLYWLNPAKFTDDDYGQIGVVVGGSYYITYAWWSHEVEQAMQQLGLSRKIYTYARLYITGIGLVTITPYVDNLANPWSPKSAVYDPNLGYWVVGAGVPQPLPSYALSTAPDHDLEWALNTPGDRVFFKIQVTPLPGQTDAAFKLQHMIVSGRMEGVFPVRGAVL